MNVNTVFLHVITDYKCHNVGAYFVLYADRMPTIHTTYTKALRTLKREPKAQGTRHRTQSRRTQLHR